ncbi:hypothetical protein E1B28_010857 [Marasmius oreades]|uniref:BAH domain-containing protein n=1 Tax=Marasmius oreades TaxID=181124 RepID=A0A9P7RTY2_9AGAR|nr:uncharacterized protein E1B28_010857 [Marasmius oreades]KAG7089151.1 hypothetical protein E1B28_010857 [Marasmius oreades]
MSYKIGDTVLVETFNYMHMAKKVPNVAVIVDMWETDYSGPEETGKMKVLVHWFVRPSELPTYRAKRNHHEDEIYYSLSGSEVLDPLLIVAPCKVRQGMVNDIPKSPSKMTWKLQRIDEASESDDDSCSKRLEDKTRSFQCRLAVDSRKGLYYTFEWNDLRNSALSSCESRSGDGRGRIAACKLWDLDSRCYTEVTRLNDLAKPSSSTRQRSRRYRYGFSITDTKPTQQRVAPTSLPKSTLVLCKVWEGRECLLEVPWENDADAVGEPFGLPVCLFPSSSGSLAFYHFSLLANVSSL